MSFEKLKQLDFRKPPWKAATKVTLYAATAKTTQKKHQKMRTIHMCSVYTASNDLRKAHGDYMRRRQLCVLKHAQGEDEQWILCAAKD